MRLEVERAGAALLAVSEAIEKKTGGFTDEHNSLHHRTVSTIAGTRPDGRSDFF
jgi:hypothetical protein